MSTHALIAPAHTHGMTGTRSIVFLLRAARFEKNVPLLFLLVGGAFTAEHPLRPWLLAFSLLTLAVSSAFMTHVNIITDAELDREKKPYLLRWLTANPRLMTAALIVEPLSVAAGLFALAWNGSVHVFLGLSIFTALTTLYSFNFFVPWKGAACRLKVYWWGHFLVCQGAYMSLWYAGHFCAEGSTWATFVPWLPIFVFVSLSEYALFLSESAFDAKQEKKFGLRTFATLLGTGKSSVLAIFVWLISFAGIATYGLTSGSDELRHLILTAFFPPMLLRGFAAIFLAAPRDQAQDDAVRSKLPDLIFFWSRVLTVLALSLVKTQLD